jgi:ribosomal protein S18 acetylase RimI-like enzyme
MAVQIRPASEYTTQQLVDIYNLTRADYLVPMPMRLVDLEEYLQVYDISLDGSVVATVGGQPVGLNLLGMREDQGWVTRLGVAASARRHGVAKALMDALLEGARLAGVRQMWLEVIVDNEAGKSLFQFFGFQPVGELVVAERPDVPPTRLPALEATVETIDGRASLEKLSLREGHVDWKNHVNSLSKLDGLSGMEVTSESGSAWIAFRPKDGRLEKSILGVEKGPVREIGWLALHHLQRLHPGWVLRAENVPMEGTIWEAYQRAGFQTKFKRLEMSLAVK